MSSHGGGTAVTGNGRHRAHIQTLARQGSLYSLTLAEVESHLGEPLLSMNLDDLMSTVLPDGMSPPLPNGGAGDPGGRSTSVSGCLERRGGGGIAMPPAPSKKTVDEVWRDIQQHRGSSAGDERSSGCDTRLTLGEVTLEEFLRRAGMAVERHREDANELQDFPEGDGAIDAHAMSQSMPRPLSIAVPSTMDAINYLDGQMSISPSAALSDLQAPPGRKRMASEEDAAYKVVDRRQKRMIKNRESAARSRARKQAYTNELENMLSRLEEENRKLKREKELDRLLKSAPPPESRKQHRRTRSSSF